jgi:hypothetical protein
MGKEDFDPPIEPVFWDGDDKGEKHPVEWRRTWVRGEEQPVGFDTRVQVRAPSKLPWLWLAAMCPWPSLTCRAYLATARCDAYSARVC